MKHDEILTKKPGRELDALVAEKVMGYAVDELFLIAQAEGPHTFDREGFTVEWSPSTDISAAWEVLEKLKEKGEVSVYSDMNGKWACEVGYIVWDDFDSAPEAICKAALAAIDANESA